MASVSANLASNIRALREKEGLSQQQIAKIAKIPRPTWANLESGEANPTVSVLTKVAAALKVGVEQLLAPPKVQASLIKATALPLKKRGKVQIRFLNPELIPGIDWERLSIPIGAQLNPVGAVGAYRQLLCCETGELDVIVEQTPYRLNAGDLLALRTDQPWTCRNAGTTRAILYQLTSTSS